MKTAIKISMLFLVVAIVFAGTTKFKKYKFKSAIVEYKLSGMQKGTKTKYISDYGYQEADYSKATMSIMGMSQDINQVVIQDGFDVITADLKEKTGSKSKNELLKMMVEEKKDIGEFGREMLKQMGGKKLDETGTVLGKTCEIWSVQNGMAKIWVWGNLSLKSEVKAMGMTMTEEAISIKTDVSIPASKFDAPKGIKYINPEDMPQGMGGMGF